MEALFTNGPNNASTSIIDTGIKSSVPLLDPEALGMDDWMSIMKTKADKDDIERL